MSTPITQAALLTAEDVERLEIETRGNLIGAIATLTRLREGRAHEVAGFAAWHEYVLDRFGDLLAELRLSVEERRELVRSMRGDRAAGRPAMSNRGIAEKLGVSPALVQADRDAIGKEGEASETVSRDGSRRAAQTGAAEPQLPAREPFSPAEGMSKADELVARVAWHVAGGAVGVSAKQLDGETGWGHASTSAGLTRLATGRAPRLAYLRPAKRGQIGLYALAEPAGVRAGRN